MAKLDDASRRYRDAKNIVHRSSDSGLPGTRITFCERYELKEDTYDSRELVPTDAPLTCVRCITLPLRMWPAT